MPQKRMTHTAALYEATLTWQHTREMRSQEPRPQGTPAPRAPPRRCVPVIRAGTTRTPMEARDVTSDNRYRFDTFFRSSLI